MNGPDRLSDSEGKDFEDEGHGITWPKNLKTLSLRLAEFLGGASAESQKSRDEAAPRPYSPQRGRDVPRGGVLVVSLVI